MQNITIIGGTNGFGKWLALFLQEHFPNKKITVTGRNQERLDQMKAKGFIISSDNIATVQDADVTIFSAPIRYTEAIIREVGPHLKVGSLALDVTSIKGFPARAMQESVPESVTVIPTHPMFGPYITTLAGQVVILTPDEIANQDDRYIQIRDWLKKLGANVIETSTQEHDKMMAVVQGLTHFDMFVLGETIHRLGIDVEQSMQFVSPIYKLMMSSAARYIGQDAELYSDIQIYNKQVLDVHKVFMEVTKDFNSFITQKDDKNFIATIEEAKKHFGKTTEKSQKYIDKIVYMLGQQNQNTLSKIGEKIIITNIYTKENITGILEKFEKEYFTID